MPVRSLLVLLLSLVTLLGPQFAGQVWAQLRVQETPALNGLGLFLFKDVEFRIDGGRGNTAATLFLDEAQMKRKDQQEARTQLYFGIFIDKPIVAHFLEMAYDCEFWERDWVPRDTWYRDLFLEPIRVVASYREGDFRVSGKNRSTEYYVGGRYSLDLGRVFRHIPVFQK